MANMKSLTERVAPLLEQRKKAREKVAARVKRLTAELYEAQIKERQLLGEIAALEGMITEQVCFQDHLPDAPEMVAARVKRLVAELDAPAEQL